MKKNPSSTVYFYQGDKLVTVMQGTQNSTILRTPALPLAEQRSGKVKSTQLLATDEKSSVLEVQGDGDEELHAYSAYGHNPSLPSQLTVCGFNGEHIEPLSASYLLGNGYRSYSPALLRFVSPDSWSPFGKAGINAYCYCTGDPVNNIDPSGHMMRMPQKIQNTLGRPQRLRPAVNTGVQMPPKELHAPPVYGLDNRSTQSAPPPYSPVEYTREKPFNHASATIPADPGKPTFVSPALRNREQPQQTSSMLAQAQLDRQKGQLAEISKQYSDLREVVQQAQNRGAPIDQRSINNLNSLQEKYDFIRSQI